MRYTLAHLTLMRPPQDMIEAAAGAGFSSVGIRICPRRPGDSYFVDLMGDLREAKRLRDLAARLGVSISNVSAYQIYPDVTIDQMLPAVEATAALGCQCIVVNNFDPDLDRFKGILDAYARAAARHGIRLALEFMPYSAIPSIQSARDVIGAVGASNVAVLVDALHLARSDGTAEEVRQMAPGSIAFAQVCDAPARPPSTDREALMLEARNSRLPLGQGELNLAAFMAALPAGTEVEYEVAGLPGATPLDVARAAKRNLADFLQTLDS
jgi:sugar phosphate isomerase/epimerase